MADLSPFTYTQSAYVVDSAACWLNILEGGKRGGKNVVNVNAFAHALDDHPDRLHLAAGVTVAAAKLNIIDCDGFGLANHFLGRCREGKYKDRDCLYVQTKTGEKIVLISGGGKLGDEKPIKGNSYGSVLITEVNECHPVFIQETLDRTLKSSNRKIFWDFNPKPPTHWFYRDFFDFHWRRQQDNPRYGLNYAHVTIADNMSISDEQIRAVLATYDKSSVWYRRDIRGERAAAEGLIFMQFANNPARWIIPEPLPHYARLFIGVDFGGSKAKTVFTLSGVVDGAAGPEIHVLAVHTVRDKRGEGIDAQQIIDEYREFFEAAMARYGITPHRTYTDHDEALRVGMKKAVAGHNHRVEFVDKTTVTLSAWCKYLNTLFNQDKLKIAASCTPLIESLKGLLFDPKADDDRPIDDDVTCDVDTYDSFRYSVVDVLADWISRGGGAYLR
ncbi:MAG: phage terminase large subunit [Desulfovibrionaceae bacterium]|nr:phage terminase large subunit [Desulfovibrionaceae bacterium]